MSLASVEKTLKTWMQLLKPYYNLANYVLFCVNMLQSIRFRLTRIV